MKKRFSRNAEPTTMMHHIKEIRLRSVVIGLVLIAGMVVGYLFYEPLFAFLKSPLHGPLHYMSPAGSFNFIVKICLLVGILIALPVAVYNIVMFIQPALSKKLSRLRVYTVTFTSLILASLGASFGFFIIIPLALEFFYKIKVDGLVELISADEYLRFVVSVAITFILIFQLPLVISFIDHVTPLSPKKLLKAEKFIIVGSILIGVLVPFALDPTIQLLIASPIIILYNISIVIVLIQRAMRRRRAKAAPLALAKPIALPRATPAVVKPSQPPRPRRPAPRRAMDIVKPRAS